MNFFFSSFTLKSNFLFKRKRSLQLATERIINYNIPSPHATDVSGSHRIFGIFHFNSASTAAAAHVTLSIRYPSLNCANFSESHENRLAFDFSLSILYFSCAIFFFESIRREAMRCVLCVVCVVQSV